MFYSFKEFVPVVHPTSFVHPPAVVTGNVSIGANVYIGPGAALRGDWGEIIVEDGCNIQENCTLHMFPGVRVILKKSAHIGHGAVIHGAVIGQNRLVGMNSVIMDNVELGNELPARMKEHWKPCEPMQTPRESYIQQNPSYRTWNESKLHP